MCVCVCVGYVWKMKYNKLAAGLGEKRNKQINICTTLNVVHVQKLRQRIDISSCVWCSACVCACVYSPYLIQPPNTHTTNIRRTKMWWCDEMCSKTKKKPIRKQDTHTHTHAQTDQILFFTFLFFVFFRLWKENKIKGKGETTHSQVW